jgi:hypothetical protein
MPVRASTTLSCLLIEVDRCRLLVACGGGASAAGGAAFGPVEMTVPGAGKNGTGGGFSCGGGGDSSVEESPTWRARPLLIARSRRGCGRTFGGGDRGCGGANAAAAGGGGGMGGGGGVPGGVHGGGAGAAGAAFAAAERMPVALRNQSANTGAASLRCNSSLCLF